MRAALPGLTALLLCAGCGAADDPPEVPSASSTVPSRAPSSTLPAGQPALPTVQAQVGGTALQVEVAVTQEQKAAGLRGREVPPGTGMVFPYDVAATVRFTMAGVDRPLVAVFARDGRAVSVEQLVPCAGTVQECPTYGPDEPVDLVLEAAPGSLPGAGPGDRVEVG